MDNKNNNKIIEMILELLKKLFGKWSDFGQTKESLEPGPVIKNLAGVSALLGDLSLAHAKDGDFVSAYIAKNNQVALDAIHSNISSLNGSISIDELKTKIVNDIKVSIADVGKTGFSKEGFSDYKNHDQQKILTAIDDINGYTMSKIDKNVWGVNTALVSGILAEVAEMSKAELSKSPLTPAQKMGVDPSPEMSNEQEKSIDIVIERKKEQEKEFSL
ncbi:hypothetical protein [Aeromonas veronii]|uniref:Uncharacterized protein n=1 Tax=Aeromonas veronii TaxID=654 RepID=A0A2T4N031_AERVE|nr:hypothetical protein [Aeromonas veronii]PTH80152.1 hypothetical protein DAA48_16485 [Aeromonas veronii]